METKVPSSWHTVAHSGEPLPPEAAALLAELLEACAPYPEVRAVSIENSEDGPAFRVWVTAFLGHVQQELDRLQAAHRSLIIIAMRLPPEASLPNVGPAETLYARSL